MRQHCELMVLNDEAHHIHDPRMAWFGFTVQIDSIKHLSDRQKTGIHGVIPYGEFLYLTSTASYPITSVMSTMTYTMR